VRVLSRLFRRLFLDGLTAAHAAGRLAFFGDLNSLRYPPTFTAYLAPLRKKNWFVYAKPPFAGPEAVLAYLARYTHRVAISNSRLLALDEQGVAFRYKDYRSNGQARYRTMTLAPHEFIRRFLLHVLPRVPSHPPLRAARQRHLQGQYRARQRTDRHARVGDRSADGARRAGPDRQRRRGPSPAMPLLRWPHDHRRDLPAMRRTPRSAVPRYRGQGRDAMTPHHRLIAPHACRETWLPAWHHCCPAPSKGACDALDHAKITPSTANAATKSRPRSSDRRQLRRPAQPLPKMPPQKPHRR
jgi:hypothetical protein